MQHFHNYTGLASFSPDSSVTRNAIIFCDAEPASDALIQTTYDWLCNGAVDEAPYACFVGRHASLSHDEMDMIMVMNDVNGIPSPNVLTTWHDKETIDEVSDIPATFGSTGQREKIWVVVGPVGTGFETGCLASLQDAPQTGGDYPEKTEKA